MAVALTPVSSERHAMLELGVLTVMVLVLVGSLIMLQRYAKRAV